MTTVPTLNLETLHLDTGAHGTRDNGVCLMEAVAWFAGEPHTDSPQCVSPYLRSFGITLNDRADDATRQKLRRFVPLVVGTAGDGLDDVRRWMAADHVIRTTTPAWLDQAGMSEHAAVLRGLTPIVDRATYNASRPSVNAARDAAWTKRQGSRDVLRSAVKAAVTKALAEKKPVADAVAVAVADAAAAAVAVADAAAVAVAVAVAVADADAVADAVADADAAAVAVAVADADADAVAVAVADAVAVAVAAADAAAVAVAVADAAAVAVAVAAADAAAVAGYSSTYSAVYTAVRARLKPIYRERFGDLIDAGWDDAIDLYSRLITAQVSV